jgi:hypothetical protein
MRLLTAVGGAVLAAATALSAQPSASRTVLVSVVNQDGAAVKDLTPADFVVQEGGQVREVTDVKVSTEPMAVALVIDTSKPMIGRDLPLRDMRAGLEAFVNAIYAANPASKMSLMDIAGAAVKTVNYTSKPEQMLKAVKRVVTAQRSSGVLIEGLVDTGKDLMKMDTPRRAIVVLCFDSPEQSSTQPSEAAVAVQKSGAAFWAVSIGTNGSAVREVLFDALPDATGGMKLSAVAGSGIETLLANVASALTTQYEVTFETPNGPSGGAVQVLPKKGDRVLRAPWMK